MGTHKRTEYMKDVIKEGIERSGVGVNIDTPLSSLLRVRVYEQGFEDGTSDLSTTNCTQAVQSTEVYAGNYALDVTIPAGNTGHIDTPMRPVSPNQRVTFTFAHKEDENITSVKLIVVWYRENLHVIDTEEFDLTPSTSWQLDSRTVAAPKNAAYMGLRMEATAGASEGHVYLDSIIMDLVGQVLSVDSEGNLKVTDTDLKDALINPILDTLVLENATVNSPGNSADLDIKGAKHIDVLIVVGTPTNSPSIQFHLDVIEPASGQVIRSYDGNVLTASGTDYITVDGLTLGTTVRVRWDGTLDGSNYFGGVYCRVVAKR